LFSLAIASYDSIRTALFSVNCQLFIPFGFSDRPLKVWLDSLSIVSIECLADGSEGPSLTWWTQERESMTKKKTEEKLDLIAQLQMAIRQSDKSLYQLSKESGVGSDQLSRFMRGVRTLTLPAVEKICRVLRLELVSQAEAEATPARKGKKRKGE
jgi:hypothetical protein